MKTIKVTRVTEEPKLVIEYDQYPESPREWSNLGYFITVDRGYSSPDNNDNLVTIIQETGDEASDRAEHMEMIKKRIEEEEGEKRG